jgi:predicted transcriptional regulator
MNTVTTMRFDDELYTRLSLEAVKQHKKKRAIIEEACRAYIKVIDDQELLKKKAAEEAMLAEYRRQENLRTGAVKPIEHF